MTETPENAQPAADGNDLSYDLSHEATAGLRHPGKRRGPVHVVQLPEVEPAAENGDYGYDLARDVPRTS